jgi:hypothetical protein
VYTYPSLNVQYPTGLAMAGCPTSNRVQAVPETAWRGAPSQ